MNDTAAYSAPCGPGRPTKWAAGYRRGLKEASLRAGFGRTAAIFSWRYLATHGRLSAVCVMILTLLACCGAVLSARFEEHAVIERNKVAVAQEGAKVSQAFAYAIKNGLNAGEHYLDALSAGFDAGGKAPLPKIIEPEEIAFVGSWGPDGKLLSGTATAPKNLTAGARRQGGGAMLIDRPLLSAAGGEYVLPLWRTVRGADGAVLGTVGVAIRPAHVLTFFSEMMIGRVGVLSLMDGQNQIMVMRATPLGEQSWALPLPNYDLWRRIDAGEALGTEIRVSPVDQRVRQIVFNAIDGTKMVVLAGTDMADITAQVRSVINGLWLKASIEIASFLAGAFLLLGLLGSLRHLHESLELNRQFLDRISHELRTPLNAVIGFSELIMGARSGPLGSPIYEDYIRMIHQSGRSLLTLVDDVLDLTALQSGRQPLAIEPLSTRGQIESVILSYQGQADAKAIRLVIFCERSHCLLADIQGFRQALGHLLDNAIKFTPEGGRVAVEVRDDPVSRRVQISVADSGPGMTPEQIRYAGDPFGQPAAYSRRAGEGSGLGLAIVRAMAIAHGGDLAIDTLYPGCRATIDFAPGKQ